MAEGKEARKAVAFSPGGGFDSVSIPVGTPRLWCGTILFVPALAKSFYTTSRHTGKIVLSDRACDWPNDCVLSKTRGVHVELEEELVVLPSISESVECTREKKKERQVDAGWLTSGLKWIGRLVLIIPQQQSRGSHLQESQARQTE